MKANIFFGVTICLLQTLVLQVPLHAAILSHEDVHLDPEVKKYDLDPDKVSTPATVAKDDSPDSPLEDTPRFWQDDDWDADAHRRAQHSFVILSCKWVKCSDQAPDNAKIPASVSGPVRESKQKPASTLFSKYNGQDLVIDDFIVPTIYSARDWLEIIRSNDLVMVKHYILGEIAFARKHALKKSELAKATHINDQVMPCNVRSYYFSDTEPSVRPYSPLAFAVMHNHIELVRALLVHPAIDMVIAWRIVKRLLRWTPGKSEDRTAIMRLLETHMVARGVTTIYDDVCANIREWLMLP